MINGLDPKLHITLNNINQDVIKKIQDKVLLDMCKNSISFNLGFKPLEVKWEYPIDNEEKRNNEFRNYVVWNYQMRYPAERNSVIKYFNDIDSEIVPSSKVFRIGCLVVAILLFIAIWSS